MMTIWLFHSFQLSTTIQGGLHTIVQDEYGLFGKEQSTQILDDIQKSVSISIRANIISRPYVSLQPFREPYSGCIKKWYII